MHEASANGRLLPTATQTYLTRASTASLKRTCFLGFLANAFGERERTCCETNSVNRLRRAKQGHSTRFVTFCIMCRITSGSNSGRTREGSILCTVSGSTLPRDSTSMWLQNSRILEGLEEDIILSVPHLIKSSSRDRSRAFMGALVYFHSRIRFLRPILSFQVIWYAEVGQKTATRAPMGNTPGRGGGEQRALFSRKALCRRRRPEMTPLGNHKCGQIIWAQWDSVRAFSNSIRPRRAG